MALLADLERLLERVFERSTARLFRAHPQAVQVERRVERSMERARATHGGRTTVPSRYRVRLNPDDLGELADRAGGAEPLAVRLADAALAFARSHDYHLPGRPSVALVADPSIQPGVIEVDAVAVPLRPSTAGQPVPGVEPRPDAARDEPAGAHGVPDVPMLRSADGPRPPAPALTPDPTPDPPAAAASAPPPVDASEPAPPEPVADAAAGGIRGDGTRTLVFRRPAPVPTRAILRVIGRDGSERIVEVDGTPLTLGRATDNGLVLEDPRVSRHHARLQARRGTLVLTDLGSTNGSRVNGVRVDECALGAGDRVLMGDTVVLVEQLPG